jgi:hypothetical protein
MLDAALAYAEEGLSVLPLHSVQKAVCSCSKGAACTRAGKHPRLARWQEKATCDPAQLRAWWSNWPEANIGIALGQGQRLVALDIDGEEGRGSLAELEATHGPLPTTRRSRSGSGVGAHLLFRIPEHLEIPGNRQKMLPGLDVRGRGGQIVVAPSLHRSGGVYSWQDKGAVAEIPAWLYGVIMRSEAPASAPAPKASSLHGATGKRDLEREKWAQSALRAECQRVTTTPLAAGRNTVTFSAAANLGEIVAAGGLLDEATVRRELVAAAQRSGLNDLVAIHHDITNGLERGLLKPRFGPKGWEDRASQSGAALELDETLAVEEAPELDEAPELEKAPFEVKEEPFKIENIKGSWSFEPGPRGQMYFFEEGEAPLLLARGCWPVALTRRVEGGEHGVRYRFWTREGRVGMGTLPAGSWTDRGAAAVAARSAAATGVQIEAEQGAAWAVALGRWSNLSEAPRTEALVTRPGWHLQPGESPVYVNGASVFGANWIFDGFEVRSGRAGTLEAWKAGARELVTTPGLKLALGVSLAGALVGRLGWPLFLVHFAGRSSSGKTSAACLGAAVWYAPHEHLQWNGTERGLTLAAEAFGGACMVLDEIKEATPEHLARIAHTLTDGRSRTLAKQSGDSVREVRRWSLTGLSTGEVTIAEHLGGLAQGGQMVRAIDVRVELGDMTHDAAHASRLARWLSGCYGVLGDAWAELLQRATEDELASVADDIERISTAVSSPDDPELGRIMRSLTLAVTTLRLASEADLLGWTFDDDDAGALLKWAAARVKEERGEATSPEERALRTLRDLFLTAPKRFPTEDDYRDGRAEHVVGIVESGLADSITTTEGMLRDSEVLKKAGVGPRQFLAWCRETGVGDGGRKRSVGGKQTRWHRMSFTAKLDTL